MPDLFKISLKGCNDRAALIRGVRPKDVAVLPSDEMHVWVVKISARDSGDMGSTQFLSADEVERAKRYRSDIDGASFIQRRIVQRIILAEYLDVSPREVVYEINNFGKLSLRLPPDSPSVSFNTSNSGNLALIAVARSGRVGVDVECLRPTVEDEAIAKRFFTANEAASLATLHAGDKITGFFNAWTRKEAVVKALGGGLSIPLNSFEVSVRPGEPAAIQRWNVPDVQPERWHMHHLEPDAGYVAAVAFENECRS